MLRSGELLDDRYRLDERVATGGMGDVWRATDVVLGRVVAVKILRAALVAEPGFAARFRSEARTLATLHHPGVVDVYDYGEATRTEGGEVTYLVMAYVHGEPLSERIAAAGRLNVAETASVVAQAARALDAAHAKGVVHRDVKPSNLLVRPDGTVVLVDFGVARSAAVTSVTGINEVVGTALYMAPEQISKRSISPATDVYALGCVAYHCLAGSPPFQGDNALQVALSHLDTEPAPLPEDVPEPVRAVITRAMAKDPADRYPSAAAFADAVEAAAPGSASASTLAMAVPAANPEPSTVALGPASRRIPRRWALAGAAVLALLLGLTALAALLVPSGDGEGGPGSGATPSSGPTTAGEPKPSEAGQPAPSRPPATSAGPATSEPESEPSQTPERSPTAGAPRTSQPATSGPTAPAGIVSSVAELVTPQ